MTWKSSKEPPSTCRKRRGMGRGCPVRVQEGKEEKSPASSLAHPPRPVLDQKQTLLSPEVVLHTGIPSGKLSLAVHGSRVPTRIIVRGRHRRLGKGGVNCGILRKQVCCAVPNRHVRCTYLCHFCFLFVDFRICYTFKLSFFSITVNS